MGDCTIINKSAVKILSQHQKTSWIMWWGSEDRCFVHMRWNSRMSVWRYMSHGVWNIGSPLVISKVWRCRASWSTTQNNYILEGETRMQHCNFYVPPEEYTRRGILWLWNGGILEIVSGLEDNYNWHICDFVTITHTHPPK